MTDSCVRSLFRADAPYRMQVENVLKLNLPSSTGAMVELSELVTPVWEQSPLQMVRYNGFPAMRISGSAAPGVSAGQAMEEMERIASQLPQGFAIELDRTVPAGAEHLCPDTDASRPVDDPSYSSCWRLCMKAGPFRSRSCLSSRSASSGAVAAVYLRGMENDVFFKVGLITIIGLSAKNAILIVEFARALYDEGHDLRHAVMEAARLRLRPIIMTSLAFTLGVTPFDAGKRRQRRNPGRDRDRRVRRHDLGHLPCRIVRADLLLFRHPDVQSGEAQEDPDGKLTPRQALK